MLKKLAALAVLALATFSAVSPALADPAFRAVGGSNRGWDGSKLTIRSLESGRNYVFYGTSRNCPGRVGDRYDSMSYVMNGNPFMVSVTPCGNGMVWVSTWDDYGNSASSGYSINYESNYRYY